MARKLTNLRHISGSLSASFWSPIACFENYKTTMKEFHANIAFFPNP